MEFKDILVDTGIIHQTFSFQYEETTEYGQACKITSGGKEAIIDEDFAIIRSNMPDHWLQAAISTLKLLLEGKYQRPGF